MAMDAAETKPGESFSDAVSDVKRIRSRQSCRGRWYATTVPCSACFNVAVQGIGGFFQQTGII